MTELHLALLALAALLLVVLYVYNKWQERRALRELDRSLRGDVGDPLLTPEPAPPARPRPPTPPPQRIEPRLGLPEPDPAPQPSGARTESAVAPPEAPVPHAVEWIEDPLLDFVLELRCTHAVDGVSVFDAAAPLSQLNLPLPVSLVAWDGRTQQWVKPDRFGFYSDLLAAVQLVDRRHTLDEIGAARFLAAVQQIAAALDADVDAPQAQQIASMAQELDRQCARFDVQIGLTVDAPDGPWQPQTLSRAIARLGLEEVEPTCWRRRDEHGRTLFSVTADSLLSDRLVLELDVPTAPADAQPLRLMAAAARELAHDLGGRVVDDHKRPIDEAALAAIESRLATLYAEMVAAGIEPGSSRALRLYA